MRVRLLLEDILRLKKDLEVQNVSLPPGLAGMYGEFLVFEKLNKMFTKKGYTVQYFSGQKGADIQLINGKRKIFIEVKTSRLKDEGYGLWYGAALNIKNCRDIRHSKRLCPHPKRGKVFGDFCYFDYLIFVALDDRFARPQFYVIPRDFLEKHEQELRNTHKRFSSGTHRIILSNNGTMPKMSIDQRKLIRETERFRDQWDAVGKSV